MSEATNSMEFPKTWGEFADYYGYVDRSKEVFVGEIEVIPRFRVEQWLEHIKPAVSPLPCVRDEHGAIKEQTVKRLFAKIDEEFDELKAAVLSVFYGLDVVPSDRPDLKNIGADEMPLIASEAADVKTAITTLEEALGIDAEMRDEAIRRVNAKNRERGRL